MVKPLKKKAKKLKKGAKRSEPTEKPPIKPDELSVIAAITQDIFRLMNQQRDLISHLGVHIARLRTK